MNGQEGLDYAAATQSGETAPSKPKFSDKYDLYVTGLDVSISEKELQEFFGKAGKVIRIRGPMEAPVVSAAHVHTHKTFLS
jgi:RNA recognition motif-containing protein